MAAVCEEAGSAFGQLLPRDPGDRPVPRDQHALGRPAPPEPPCPAGRCPPGGNFRPRRATCPTAVDRPARRSPPGGVVWSFFVAVWSLFAPTPARRATKS